MPKPQTATNPFYALLVVVGVLFVITAFAYFTMTLRQSHAGDSPPSGLVDFLARHGLWLLVGELVLLAIGTFGAIGTDDYWTRRAQAQAAKSPPDSPPDSPS